MAHELDDPGRDEWQNPHWLIQWLELKPGMTVVDLGAGTGYMLPFLADAVGPGGKVYAAEIQDDFVALLKQRIHQEQLGNTEVIKTTVNTLPVRPLARRVP